MTAMLHRVIAIDIDEPNDIDLARLDDDGGARAPRDSVIITDSARQQSEVPVALPLPVASHRRAADHPFKTPMIPGAREPGSLTTFGVHTAVIPDSPTTMDAATIAARQREGGGAPNQRRPPRQGSLWTSLKQTMRRVLNRADRS